MQDVRVFFEKTGMTKYISHLDLMRCMTRAIKRAAIPAWYTEGFNPHLFITFALPLTLGVESLCESMDIRLTEEMGFEEVKNRLNVNLPDGIRITNVAVPVYKANDIAFAEYKITFHTRKNEKIKNEIEEKLLGDELLAEKMGKQGKRKVLKTINLKEFVNSYSVISLNDKTVLTAVLTAGSKNNINPNLFVDALKLGDDVDFCEILKQKMMTEDLKSFE